MSSIKPFAGAVSIWKGPTDYDKPLKDLGVLSAKASKDIAANADITVSLADIVGSQEEFNEVLNSTGLTTEIIAENLAEKARGSEAEYKIYQEQKREILNGIRSRIVRLYIETYKQLLTIGYTKEEARSEALKSALAIKGPQMDIFRTLFPAHGQKANRIY